MTGRTTPPTRPDRLPRLPAVIGHRGAAGVAPENSLAGLRAAAAAGVTWVEVDVHITADGVPVLLHDADLARTTDGRGAVADRSAREVEALDAGRRFDPRFAGERVPRLDAALAELHRLGLGAVLEIKDDDGHGLASLRACLDAVVRLGSRPTGPDLLVSCSNPDVVAAAAREAPDLPRALVVPQLPPDGFGAFARLDCHSLHGQEAWIDRETAAAARAVAPLVAYTVNDASRAAELRALGVTSVISDVPDVILAAARAAGVPLGAPAMPATRRQPPAA